VSVDVALDAIKPVYTRKVHAIATDGTRTICGMRRRPTWKRLGSWPWLLNSFPRDACVACLRKTRDDRGHQADGPTTTETR